MIVISPILTLQKSSNISFVISSILTLQKTCIPPHTPEPDIFSNANYM